MNKKKMILKAGVFLLATVLTAQWVWADVITDRQQKQGERITQAVKEGKISVQQEKTLADKQQKIEQARVKALKDGKLSPKAEKKLQKQLDSLDKKIDKSINKKRKGKKHKAKKATEEKK